MSEHTPGPWRKGDGVWPRDGGVTAVVYEEKTCLPIALAWNSGEDWSRPANENIANARLIAAAPDLLDALKECHADMLREYPASSRKAGNWPDTAPWFARVEAAIAKAEGQS